MNMKNTIQIAALTLPMAAVLGWGKYYDTYSSNSEIIETSYFPMNENQGWYTEESYLLWKPYVRDLDFALKEQYDIPTDSTEFYKVKTQKPDFEWNSGVRIGVGRYLPNHDHWDISFFMVYFYGTASKKTRANFDKNQVISSYFSDPMARNGVDKSSAQWRMNFYNWDLNFGRLFSLPYSITLHPFAGIRAALIDQTYRSRYSGYSADEEAGFDLIDDFTLKFKAINDYWGIGPRAGADFSFNFKRHWNLIGNLAASILYGYYEVKETANGRDFEESFSLSFTGNNFLKAEDHGYAVRANVEAALGLGWESWFRNQTVRVAPSILLESAVWFSMNQLFDYRIVTDVLPDFRTPHITNIKRHGNLVFTGFSFNLQVDF